MKASELIKQCFEFEEENGQRPGLIHLSRYQVDCLKAESREMTRVDFETHSVEFAGIPVVFSDDLGPRFSA